MSVLLVFMLSSSCLTFLFRISLSFSSLLISNSFMKPSSWSSIASCSWILARASFSFLLFFGSSCCSLRFRNFTKRDASRSEVFVA